MRFDLEDIRYTVVNAVTTRTAIAADPGDGYKVVLLGAVLTADAAANVLFESATTAISGTFELAADTPLVLPPTGLPYLECAASEALNLTSDVAINGWVQFAILRS